MRQQHQTDIIESEVAGARPPASLENESEISVIDLLITLAARRRIIFAVTLVFAFVTAIVVFLWHPYYRAEAVIMPPQQPQSSLSSIASGALGALGGLGVASELGIKNATDLYVGVLKSRTIADAIIEQFHLSQVYGTSFPSDTRRTLERHTSISAGKDTLIHIRVEDHDARRAAGLANAFADELYKQNARLALTDASQRRLFFEQQLAKEKDALSDAEIALKNTQQSTGLVVPAGQAEALIRSGAQLRAEIASREVQLQAMRSFATEENPQVQVVKREIEALRNQLAQLEAKGAGGGSMEVSAGKLPEASLQYIRKMRDMKYHETLYELLAKQYEAARIDEAKSAPVIQTVDRAVVPDKKSWPPKALLTASAAVLGFVLACGWVFISEAFRRSARSPEQAARIKRLRSEL
jgi:uncharacterized protein involved in exopolysaccharide biosynthesis